VPVVEFSAFIDFLTNISIKNDYCDYRDEGLT
jgi:hypothetical protein